MGLNDNNFLAAVHAARPTFSKLDRLSTNRDEISDYDLPTLEGMKFDLGTMASVLEAVISEKYAAESPVDHASEA